MKCVYEKRIWKFRGEEFEYYHTSWKCEDTGEQFTTDESDMAGYVQVTNQYRVKYGIPFTDEIIAVRKKYDISASKMSQILGIGINQYRLYEQGEVPSVSNGRMIRSIMEPHAMLSMVESSKNDLSSRDYSKLVDKVKLVLSQGSTYNGYVDKTQYVARIARCNGYSNVSVSKLKNVIIRILSHYNDIWCANMNIILFYVDFLSYRDRGYSMTGLSYRAFEIGIFPEEWDCVFCLFKDITQVIKNVGGNAVTVLHTDVEIEEGVLTDADIEIIDKVYTVFSDKLPIDISKINRLETAWVKYKDRNESIPYEESFSLYAI